jgi:hypothetical protein
MVQIAWYARGNFTTGALDAGHQAAPIEESKVLMFQYLVYLAHDGHPQATPADIENIYDVCWMLSPMQIQRMCTNYYVADYEVRNLAYLLKINR